MILAYLGQDVSEAHLARLFKTRSFGASADHIRLLSQLGYAVLFERGTEFDLSQGSPSIVFVKTVALPYWNT